MQIKMQKILFLQSLLSKIHKNYILHTHDYVLFKKMYYLCIEFQKQHKITKKNSY